MPQRSSIDSPMPMMPPEQTVMPALRTRSSVSQPVVVGAGRDDRLVVLARGVEVVVVGVEPGLLEAARLIVGEHAERAAGLEAERFTPRTMSSTRSNAGPSFTSRQAAPMQKRVAPRPCARPRGARAPRRRREHLLGRRPASRSGSICGQYAQSSGQPPGLHAEQRAELHRARFVVVRGAPRARDRASSKSGRS